jgi:hypothetical protein
MGQANYLLEQIRLPENTKLSENLRSISSIITLLLFVLSVIILFGNFTQLTLLSSLLFNGYAIPPLTAFSLTLIAVSIFIPNNTNPIATRKFSIPDFIGTILGVVVLLFGLIQISVSTQANRLFVGKISVGDIKQYTEYSGAFDGNTISSYFF